MANGISSHIFSGILWIHLILLNARCHSNRNGEKTVGGANEETIIEEKYLFRCETPLNSGKAIRQFPANSDERNVQLALDYGDKPYWPSQWFLSDEEFKFATLKFIPSMGIAETHFNNIKGDGVGVVIIANVPVNCEHKQLEGRCHAKEETKYSLYGKDKKTLLASMKSLFKRKKTVQCSSPAIATTVAGIIGMTDVGEQCGVGIAPHSHIGNIVINSKKVGAPEILADQLASQPDSPVDLFVHAWHVSYHDSFNEVLRAWGNIQLMNIDPANPAKPPPKPHVIPSGDLGLVANSCQLNEYASADSALVYGSVDYTGYVTHYSETCASLMGVTYSTSNGAQFYNNVVSISSSNNIYPSLAPKGTTAVSAAVAGGIVALIIDAYKLKHDGISPTIMDLAFLLAFSSNADPLQDKNSLWFTNAVGCKYSLQAGFGLPNMGKIRELLQEWMPIDKPIVMEVARIIKGENPHNFVCKEDEKIRKSLTYGSNLECTFVIVKSTYHIQSVVVELFAKMKKRGSLTAYLTSPGGTSSCLLEGRPYDTSHENYKKLRLRSNHFIGESALGIWTLRFFTYKENSEPTLSPLREFKSAAESAASPSASSHPVGKSANPESQGPEAANGSLSPDNGSRLDGSEPTHETDQSGVDAAAPKAAARASSAAKRSDSKRAVSAIGQIKVRFMMVPSLPTVLQAQPRPLDSKESAFDLQLMKAWVDFRHFLLTNKKVDPELVPGYIDVFVQMLQEIQRDQTIESLADVSLERLKSLNNDFGGRVPPTQDVDHSEGRQ